MTNDPEIDRAIIIFICSIVGSFLGAWVGFR